MALTVFLAEMSSEYCLSCCSPSSLLRFVVLPYSLPRVDDIPAYSAILCAASPILQYLFFFVLFYYITLFPPSFCLLNFYHCRFLVGPPAGHRTTSKLLYIYARDSASAPSAQVCFSFMFPINKYCFFSFFECTHNKKIIDSLPVSLGLRLIRYGLPQPVPPFPCVLVLQLTYIVVPVSFFLPSRLFIP